MIFRYVFLPALGLLTADNPELAHEIAVKFIGSGLAPVDQGEDGDSLAFEVSFEPSINFTTVWLCTSALLAHSLPLVKGLLPLAG